MAELNQKLHVMKNGITEEITCYTTAAEVQGQALTLRLGGLNCYAKYGDANDPDATQLNVRLPNGADFRVLKKALHPYTEKAYTTPGTFTFTVPGGITKLRVALTGGGSSCSAHRNSGGYDHTESTFGTSLYTSRYGMSGPTNFYNQGVNLSFTASRQNGGYGCGTQHGHEGRVGTRKSYQSASSYISTYVDVTPGQQIPLTVGRGGYFYWSFSDSDIFVEEAQRYGGNGYVLIAWGGDII